jgi:oligoendopeptidase F
VLTIIPWIATIDKFQHWIYENPNHTVEERTQRWYEILNEFASPVIDQSGLDDYRKNHWQKQLHLFEVPFTILNMALHNWVR